MMTNKKQNIMDSMFVRYLKQLTLEGRAIYLTECMRNVGELYLKLGEHLDEYDPIKLAIKLEDLKKEAQ